jgi:hypothetical protein
MPTGLDAEFMQLDQSLGYLSPRFLGKSLHTGSGSWDASSEPFSRAWGLSLRRDLWGHVEESSSHVKERSHVK